MRVKKFEAKTMKDALKMVKAELGPDAVILGARENKRSFGLGGEGSFEVTAAVSDITLQKKKFVESRMRDGDRERFRSAQARRQKEVIEKMVQRRAQQQEQERQVELQGSGASLTTRPITPISYIDIPDDQPVYARRTSAPQKTLQPTSERRSADSQRPADVRGKIRSLAKAAWDAGNATEVVRPAQPAQGSSAQTGEIETLKQEIHRLQALLTSFKAVPQSFQTASGMTVHPGAFPGAEYGLSYDVSATYQKLTEAGVSAELAAEIVLRAQREIDPIQAKKRFNVEAWVAKWFLQNISVCERPFASRFQVFVGPTGSGKTSQLVKAASRLIIQEKKRVAIVSADTSKVGAVDQLKIYCQILNVPFAVVRKADDWKWIEGPLSQVDFVLVDMPGLVLCEADEISRLRGLLPAHEASQVHLCLSATTKETDALEAVRRFRVAQPTDLIFTGLDLSVNHGVISTVQIRSGLPLHSFGIGARVPEDFEIATKERVLDLLFKLSAIKRPTEN